MGLDGGHHHLGAIGREGVLNRPLVETGRPRVLGQRTRQQGGRPLFVQRLGHGQPRFWSMIRDGVRPRLTGPATAVAFGVDGAGSGGRIGPRRLNCDGPPRDASLCTGPGPRGLVVRGPAVVGPGYRHGITVVSTARGLAAVEGAPGPP